MKEAEGGQDWKTAYWLVYVQNPIMKHLKENWDINKYNSDEPLDKTYESLIPEDILGKFRCPACKKSKCICPPTPPPPPPPCNKCGKEPCECIEILDATPYQFKTWMSIYREEHKDSQI